MDHTGLSFRIPSLILSNSLKNESTNYSQNYNSKNPLKISSSLPKIYTPYSNARNKILNKIYQENGDWFNKFKQIKKNNCIALKKNFNIVNYQHKLFDIFISNNARLENNKILCKMKKNFMKIYFK